jgi:putative signal transducing protein
MARIDPEQERRRLAEFYAQQTDGELESVARQSGELTEIAREALRAELGKRGLYVGFLENVTVPDDGEQEFRNLVTIRTFWNPLEADLAKGVLEEANIESFLFDENMIRQNFFYASALGGVRLRVDAANVEEANRILEEQTIGPPLEDSGL